jgi:hypothetical protein
MRWIWAMVGVAMLGVGVGAIALLGSDDTDEAVAARRPTARRGPPRGARGRPP